MEKDCSLIHYEFKQMQTSPSKQPNANDQESPSIERLLRLPEVELRVGLRKSSIYTMPDFPKPIVLSRRCVAWKQSEISAWIASRSKRVDAKS
jgi:prophage regulatory protein